MKKTLKPSPKTPVAIDGPELDAFKNKLAYDGVSDPASNSRSFNALDSGHPLGIR